MATYMSRTRDVLSTTITNVTSYSSAILDVGDLIELTIDVNVTAHTGGNYIRFDANRIDLFSNAFAIGGTNQTTANTALLFGGAGRTVTTFFGDKIQITLNNPNADTVSATISVKGKG